MKVITVPRIALHVVDSKQYYYINGEEADRKEFLQWVNHLHFFCEDYLRKAEDNDVVEVNNEQ